MTDVRVTPQPWLRMPRIKPIRFIEIHATRGNTTPEKQMGAALNWVQSPRNVGNLDGARNIDYANPEWGSSFSYVIGTDGSMGTVLDDNQMPTYSAGYGGTGSTYAIDEYGISYELAQSQAQEPFTDQVYDRLTTEVAVKCLKYNIPPVMVSIMSQKGTVPAGIVRHDRCENGIKLGKTDPGVQFNEVRFIAALKAKMEPEREPEPVLEPISEPESLKEESMVIVIIKAEGDNTQYILNTDGRKYRLGSLEHRNALNRLDRVGGVRIEYRELPAADVAAIPDEHA